MEPRSATSRRHSCLECLACSSHNAMWEKNHRVLFQASLDWLTKGKVNGMDQGQIKLGE